MCRTTGPPDRVRRHRWYRDPAPRGHRLDPAVGRSRSAGTA
jgi:hypothetical protein